MFLPVASNIAIETDMVLLIVGGICIFLLAVITLVTLYFVIRYGRRRCPVAVDVEGSRFHEAAFLIISVAIVLLMFNLGWRGYKKLRVEIPERAIEVTATGQMWVWSFKYENGKESATLNLPVNKPVRMRITSRDVIHSFYVPAFRVKQDALPNSERMIYFTPDMEGTYDLFCAEYCGTGHSTMHTKAVVMAGEKFNAWYGAAREAKRGALSTEDMARMGKELYTSKGCSACHSIDGSRIVGPSWKEVYGSRVRVITDGREREVIADEAYIHRSELEPNADLVVGFPAIMPSQKGILTEEEISAITEFIKTLK